MRSKNPESEGEGEGESERGRTFRTPLQLRSNLFNLSRVPSTPASWTPLHPFRTSSSSPSSCPPSTRHPNISSSIALNVRSRYLK